ncbi:FGGY-family carbohydrate kinase [Nocardiopsis mangrovi]|uniref:FGGY-family carbohydrate kinase n=1 Tax=Nocardiopsis mangrovi TaxID=1179818 RepID=A0ABV9E133_9ACTN
MLKDQTGEGRVWIGVDIGTQSVRVLAVTAQGGVAGSGTAPLHGTRTPQGRHEQDPAQWWAALGAAARSAVAGLGPGRIAAVALCGTSGSFLLTDGAGRPLTPAFMYDDARARAEAADVQAAGADTWARLGYTMQPSWALPKLVWALRAGLPGVRRGAVRLAHQPDHLVSRLVGHRVATDSSHALKTGYSPADGGWPGAVMDALGVPEGVLPDVVAPGTLLGRISAEGAGHTGLPAGVPVVAGMTDGCAAQIAAGALEPGQWNSVLGTTLVLKGVTEDLLHDPSGAVYSHRHPDGGWLPGGASSVGAGAIADRFPGRDPRDLDALAAARTGVPAPLYPLRGRGERFPFLRPDAEGFEAGAFADDAERHLAVLYGVAYVERLSLAHLRGLGARVAAVSLTGGGARSRLWTQIRADVLGMPVRLPEQSEPAFGMAVLAAARGSVRRSARAMVRTHVVVDPRPDHRAAADEGYHRMLAELARRDYLPPHLAPAATEGTA